MPYLAICKKKKKKTIYPKYLKRYFQKQYTTTDELLRVSSDGHHRKVTEEIADCVQ